jgi:hypothetical protein
MKSVHQNTDSPRSTRRLRLTHLAMLVALLVPLLAARQASADFSGYYDPSNWTLFNSTGTSQTTGEPVQGNGFVDTTLAPVSITLFGSDFFFDPDLIVFEPGINTDYTITAAASGTWSFDWLYTSNDIQMYDDGGYLVNGAYTLLAYNQDSPASGSVSIGVNAGDVIGFRIHTLDNWSPHGQIAISNFNAPVPAPGALALLGLAGVVSRSRRRRF